MNERDLRIGFEDDGMSESEIERALDQHEASEIDDEVPTTRPVNILGVRASVALAALGLMAAQSSMYRLRSNDVSDVPALSRIGRQYEMFPKPPKPSTRASKGWRSGPHRPAGSKLARKAAKGKL